MASSSYYQQQPAHPLPPVPPSTDLPFIHPSYSQPPSFQQPQQSLQNQHDDSQQRSYQQTHFQQSSSAQAQFPNLGRPHPQDQVQIQTVQDRKSIVVQQPNPLRANSSRSKANSRSRSFSFRSTGSGGNKSDQPVQAPVEKEAKGLNTKADPTLAINEAEPSTIAAMRGGSNLSPLRSIQHKDALGNPIEDPDRCNPTRSRWERPLETIRAFEEAIDGEYNRRSLYIRSGHGFVNRDSYYSQRNSFRPASTQFEIGVYPSVPSTSYYGDSSHHNGHQPAGWGGDMPPSRFRPSRLLSEPGPSSNQRDSRDPRDLRDPRDPQDPSVYPLQHNDRSYETVTSAAGSGSSEQAGYQTDPTSGSDQSSMERNSPGKLPDSAPRNDYGISFSRSPIHTNSQLRLPVQTNSVSINIPPLAANNNGKSAAPIQDIRPQVTRLVTSQKVSPLVPAHGVNPVATKPEAPIKRMSWLRRTLSKRTKSETVA